MLKFGCPHERIRERTYPQQDSRSCRAERLKSRTEIFSGNSREEISLSVENPGNRITYDCRTLVSQNMPSIARIPENDKLTFFEVSERRFQTFNASADMGYMVIKKRPFPKSGCFSQMCIRDRAICTPLAVRLPSGT